MNNFLWRTKSAPIPRYILSCLFFASLYICLLNAPAYSAAITSLKPVIFTPITARTDSDPRTSWKKTMTDAGITEKLGRQTATELGQALITFQKNPNMANAIGTLEYFKTIAANLNDGQRQALFDNDGQVFQNLDAAKYELALQTSKRLGKGSIDHLIRAGSSGARYQAWLLWTKTRDLDHMPELSAAIQFKSDDDITHVAPQGDLAKNPMAAEDINGKNAALAFIEVSKGFGYTKGLDPERVMIEFLSPLQTFIVLKNSGQLGNNTLRLPEKLQAFINSNQEKYNGLFAEEQLRLWADQKGIVTLDVEDPTAKDSTKKYKEFSDSDSPKNPRALPNFINIDDLHVWIANNQRMIFQVHQGDIHSLAKYSLRMIAGYEALGIKLPDVAGNSLENLRQAANAIYRPSSMDDPQKIINANGGVQKIKSVLDSYCRKMVLDSHDLHIKTLLARFRDLRPANGSEDEFKNFCKRVESDDEIKKIKANLALAYSNIDQDLQKQLLLKAEDSIDKGTPADRQSINSSEIMHGMVATELKKCIDEVDFAATDMRKMADSFQAMRDNMGELLDQGLFNKRNITLDTLLLRVAKNDFTVDEWVWDRGGVSSKSRVKSPDEVNADLMILRGMNDFFGWDQGKLVDNTLDYFEGNPSEGVKYIQLLHKVFGQGKPLEIKYKDADGNMVRRTIPPSTMQRGLSLGLLTFKSALKGYSLWNDGKDGKKLFINLQSMYGGKSSTLTTAEIKTLQAESLALYIGLVDYADLFRTFGSIRQGFQWPIPTGTLANIASLSGGNIALDDKAMKNLTLSVIKDLCSLVSPHLAVFFTTYDLVAWGYDKYMLDQAEKEIVNLLVENGKWDFDLIGKPEFKDKKHPELVKLCLSPEITEINKNTKDFKVGTKCMKWLPGAEIKKISRLPDTYSGFTLENDPGILSKKSKLFVHPREQIIEIAYRKNYIGSNSNLGLFEKVAQEFFAPTIGKINSWAKLNDPRAWTQKELKDTLAITYPDDIREDLTKFPRSSLKKISVGEMASAWTIWRTPLGGIPWSVDPNKIISDNTRRMFALFVADYWSKRQILLEGPVLDAIIEKASRKAYKDEKSDDPVTYYEDYLDLLRRTKLIDDKVWDIIADAATPDYVERHKSQNSPSKNSATPDKNAKNKKVTKAKLLKLDPGPKYPIAKNFLKTNKPDLYELIKCVEWLNQPEDERQTFKKARDPILVNGNPQPLEPLELTEQDVKDEAKKIMEKLCDRLFKYETTYDGIMKTMSQTNAYVAQGNSYSIQPKYHLYLSTTKGPAEDKITTGEWHDEYKKALVKTETDVAQYLRDCRDKRGVSFIEDLLRSWNWTYRSGKEEDAARAHPYWPRLLRLRFQINKLENIKKVITFVSKNSFRSNLQGRLHLNNEPLEIPDNLTYSIGSTTNSSAKNVKQWIDEVQKKMEDEYNKLIIGMTDMFIVKLEVKRLPSQGKMKVLTYMMATATIRQKKEPNVKPSPGDPQTDPKANNQPLTVGNTGKNGAAQADNSIGSTKPSSTANLFGPLSASQEEALNDTIKAHVQKFRWRIYDQKGRDIFVDEISGKTSKKKPGNPLSNPANWLFPFTEAKHFFLEFTLVGKNNLTLGQKEFSLRISEATIKGQIKIWGDWPEDQKAPQAPDMDLYVKTCQPTGNVSSASDFSPTLDPDDPATQAQAPQCKQWGSAEINHIKVPAGRNQLLSINENVKKISINSDILKTMVEEQDIRNYMYGDFKIVSKWGYRTHTTQIGRERFTETVRDKQSKTPGEGIIEPEILLIADSPQFEMFVPYRELVTVKVTDASGDKSKAHLKIFRDATLVAQSEEPFFKWKTTATFPSNNPKEIKFRAEGERTIPPKVKATSPVKIFAPEKPTELTVRLPLFNAKNLTIRGRFVAKPDLKPPLNISGGLVTSNLGYETSVGSDGDFSFKNRKPWKQLDKFEVRALIWEGDKGRVFRPLGGVAKDGFSKPIFAKEFDMGNLELERHEVKVDPIPVKITDWRGRELPDDKLKVTIGDQPATWDGEHFTGSWTFTKRRETLEIKASLAMDYGTPVTGTTEYTISDKDFLAGELKITNPLTIKLEVYYPFSVFFKNEIDAPKDQPKPARVKLTSAEIEGFNPPLNKYEVDADSEESVLIKAPVRLDQILTIHAQAPPVKPQYRGSGSVVIPRKPGRANMTIVLIDKKTAPAISIQQLSVSGIGKDKKPIMGKGMVGTATITVGEIESPQLSLNWMRKSDRAGEGELQVISVENNTSYPVSKNFGPVPKNLQSKYDTLYLTVSDGGTPPQGDKAELDFEWQEPEDEFVWLKTPLRAQKGDKVEISSSWIIAEEMGSEREITYSANGTEFFSTTVNVHEGKRFNHPSKSSVVLDTARVKAGTVTITTTLTNSDPPMSAFGSKSFKLEEDKDQIVRAAALAANNQGEAIDTESGINLWAQVKAGQDKDGLRTLTARFRSQHPSTSFELKGGASIDQALKLDTKGLRPSHYSARLKLFGPEGKLEDSKVVHFTIQKKKDPNDSGLRDVYCESPIINLKFWDHATQDDDTVLIRIGKNWKKTVNLNACGGPKEPTSGGCVHYNLKLKKGEIATIIVKALDEGTISPNTASLKIDGGCTPSLQHWNLKTGASGKVTIRRGKPPKKRKRR